MATFFGEILPVTSRAVDDDDEDEDDVPVASSSFVHWSSKTREEMEKTATKKLPCDTLIIAVGPAATGFTQTFIMQDRYEILGGVFSGLKDRDIVTLGQQSATDKTCFLYRSLDSPGVVVCQCKTDVTQEQCFSWVEEVLGGFELSSCYVAVLCSLMTSEYKSDIPISELTTPFLRGLKTAHYPASPACAILEQPSMLTGLPAQVMSYCQVHGVKAIVYISYTDSIFLDLPTMKMFKPLLKATPLKDVVKSNPQGDKMLLKIVDQHTSQNTLYL
ncbi:proteasome assembly chaperone 1-like [Haliotis cracherodii]|uniref:proteasome assembly chaperone 1-like n=1 Tax=Haliotis cracherodii TaxID=6455 RepID=UPI0039E899CB